jgi:hypothetical protein
MGAFPAGIHLSEKPVIQQLGEDTHRIDQFKECISMKATVEKVRLRKSSDESRKPMQVAPFFAVSFRLGWPKQQTI